VVLTGAVLEDLYRIAVYGESFKHCWKSGATINFKGSKLYFANEARTSIMIYATNGEQALFPSDINIICEMIPEKSDWVAIEKTTGGFVISFGERGHITKNTFRQQKEIAEKVISAFNKHFEQDFNKYFTVETSIFDALTKDIDVTTLALASGEFSMTQQSPDAEVKSERIWSLDAAARGTMLRYMRRKLPEISVEVMVGTDELQGLTRLSPTIDLCIQGKEKPLCGRISMLAGEAILMLYPFIYKGEK
jgi:hypothetical protein